MKDDKVKIISDGESRLINGCDVGTRFGITHNPEEILQCDGPTGGSLPTKKNEEEDEVNLQVIDDIIPGIDDNCEQLQEAVILVGHGINRVSWFRRVHVLSSIGKATDAKKMLAEEKNRKILAEATTNALFTKAFDEGAKEEISARKNVIYLLKPTSKKTESSAKKGTSKPFSANPFRQGGGSGGGSGNSFSNKGKGGYGPKGGNPMQRRNDFHSSSSRCKAPTSATSGQHALSTRLVNFAKHAHLRQGEPKYFTRTGKLSNDDRKQQIVERVKNAVQSEIELFFTLMEYTCRNILLNHNMTHPCWPGI